MKGILQLNDDHLVIAVFTKGEKNETPFADFIANGNDPAEFLKEYFEKHPEATENVLFRDIAETADCEIVFHNTPLAKFAKTEIKNKISHDEMFLALLPFRDIAANTLAVEEQGTANSAAAPSAAILSEALADLKKQGIKYLINRHPHLILGILGIIMLISLVYGISGGCASSSAGYIANDYTNGIIDRKLKGMQSSLSNFRQQYKNDPELSLLNIEEVLWFDKNIDRGKLSAGQKSKLDSILAEARKLKLKIRSEKSSSAGCRDI